MGWVSLQESGGTPILARHFNIKGLGGGYGKNGWGQALFIIFPLQNFWVFSLDEGQAGVDEGGNIIILFFQINPILSLGLGLRP